MAKEKRRLSHCRQFKIVSAWDRAEVVRNPAIKEPTGSSTSGAEAQRFAISNAGRWNTVGQGGRAHRRVTSITKFMTGAEGMQVTDKEQEVTKQDARSIKHIKLRVVGQDGNEFHFRIKQTTQMGKLKKSYSKRVGVSIGNGEEDCVVKPKEGGRRRVDSSFNRIVNSLSLRAPITDKYKSTLKKFVKTGLEWIRPLQGNLARELAGVRQEASPK